MIGTLVTVTVDRPLGSRHPNHPDLLYTVNYGYINGIIAADGEEQDVYILGVYTPLKTFRGMVIGILHRLNDVEDKWIVAPEGIRLSREEILELVWFQERYFQTELFI